MAQPDLITFFKDDHGRCDAAWTALEESIASGPTEDTPARWEAFQEALHNNIAHEEDVLFPSFERATGMTDGGPTFVMRMEHQQMRSVLDQMARAAAGSDWTSVLDYGDTLLMLIQQHNAKEEGCLFPMAADALGATWGELLSEIEGRK